MPLKIRYGGYAPIRVPISGEIAAIRKAGESHCRWMKSADDFLFGNRSRESFHGTGQLFYVFLICLFNSTQDAKSCSCLPCQLTVWGICIIISSILNNIRMKVKVGFIEGAEEWQINFFYGVSRRLMDLFLSLKLIRKGLIFLLPSLGYICLPERIIFSFWRNPGKIVIMDVLGEALAPNLNLFDYHIGFDAPDDDGRLLCMSYLF